MKKNVRIKPGKGQSMAGFVGGILFCCIGLFVVIPAFGAFGIIWTLFALVITVVNGVNAFSEKGIASHEIVIDSEEEESGGQTGGASEASAGQIRERLETLRQLYAQGAVTDKEYEEKRKKILDEI